jgi:hypothetical protein
MGNWRQANSGRQIVPTEPDVHAFNYDDIANGLALIPRYGGQGRVDRYYSVAEHCIHITNYAERFTDTDDRGLLAALLHDASEAILGCDLGPGIKEALEPLHGPLEEAWTELIMSKYGAMGGYNRSKELIKRLDKQIVFNEKAAIMRVPRDDWPDSSVKPLQGVSIQCWSPEQAKLGWLMLFRRLTNDRYLKEDFDVTS